MKNNKRDLNIDLILVITFLYMFSSMLVNPLVTGYARQMGAGTIVMGLIGSMTSFCSLLCRPFTGRLADRISKYRMSLFGLVMLFSSSLLFFAAQNSIHLAVARILGGLGLGFCSVSFSTWLSSLVPKDNIGSGIGKYGIVYAISQASAPAVGVWVQQQFGYRTAFVFALTASVLGLILVHFITDKGTPVISSRDVGGEKYLKMIDVNILPVSAVMMLLSVPYFATQLYIVQYVSERGLGVSTSLFFPVYAVSLLLMRILLKEKFDQWKYSVFFFPSMLCTALAYLLLNFMQGNLSMILAAVFMAGGYGLMTTVSQSTAIMLASPGNEGLANNTYLVGTDLGTALGAFLGGILYTNVPLRLFYPLLLLVVPAALAVFLCFRRKFSTANRQ